MESTSMYNLFLRNGKLHIFGWILFIVMLIAFAFTIYNNYFSIKKLRRDDIREMLKMAELELNLREVRGSQYKESKYKV